ncbi:MAG: hypothetical protein AVO34_07390 [Firmicutes bacterium ML8_F2]|nr:MAG: hypothetical protein AVO34_07390 [Firmicutes bacterium ML8_F2]
MKAIVIEGPRSLALVDKPVPVPGPGEVLVRVKYCGICGSDLHAYETGFLQPGLTIGHEFSGTIAALGTKVDGWRAGDYVTGNNIIACGRCRYCLRGEDNLCLEMRRLGITDQGSMAEYVLVPAKDLVRLPDQRSLATAALAEPLSVGLHAVNRAVLDHKQPVLIIGAGTIGLVILAVLKHRGAGSVYVAEPNQFRRETASKMGAEKVLDPLEVNLDREVENLTENRGMSLVFDCAGHAETIAQACSLGAAGSMVVVPSICYQPVTLNFLSLVTREVKINTAFGKTGREFREAVDMITGGRMDLSPLVTAIISPAETEKAFRETGSGNIKTLVLFHDEVD